MKDFNHRDILCLYMNWNSIVVFLTILIILLTAFAIRFSGVTFGFPLLVHPDEPLIIDSARLILQNRDLNPHFFQYPSLYIYSQAFIYVSLFMFGKVVYGYEHLSDLEMTTIYFWGRLLTVLLSTITIYLVYLIGHHLFNKKVALFAILFVSFSTLHIFNSYTITVDSPMTFWITLSFLMSTLIYTQGPKAKYYVLNGVFIGCAIGTKYLAIWSVLPLIIAHTLNYRVGCNLINKQILIGLSLIPLTFYVTTPYSILDAKEFFRALQFQFSHYSSGHAGFEDDLVSYGYYVQVLLSKYGLFPVFLACVGFLLMWKDKAKLALFFSFPLVYFLFVGSFKVHFDRNVVALIPFLGLSTGYTLSSAIDFLSRYELNKPFYRLLKGFTYLLIAGAVFVSIYVQLESALDHIRIIKLPDTRLISMNWVEKHIPKCAKIGREHFTPPLNSTSRNVEYLGYWGLIEKDITKFDYLIASGEGYDRFFNNVVKYPEPVQKYTKIFTDHLLIKEFTSDNIQTSGPTIRIYQTQWSNPECRVEE